MTVTTIDRTALRLLTARMAELLAPMEAEFGIKLRMGAGHFGDTNGDRKVEFSIVQNGVAQDKRRSDFVALATLYGLQASDLDRVIIVNREQFKITGLATKAHKYPVIATKLSTGKSYKLPVSYVTRAAA